MNKVVRSGMHKAVEEIEIKARNAVRLITDCSPDDYMDEMDGLLDERTMVLKYAHYQNRGRAK